MPEPARWAGGDRRAINAADPFAPLARRSALSGTRDPVQLGALSKAYVIWVAGASCEGCTVAATGGTSPRIEQLLVGAIPGVPRVELVHTALAVECGAEYIENLTMAAQGELDAPYLLVVEGSVLDESRAGRGFWGGLGEDPRTGDQLTGRDWIGRLAPGAAGVVALGTCAAWGGVPAAAGNPTGATSLGAFLGRRFRSRAGLPVVNVPGCAPVGDNFLETVTAVLLFLNGMAPAPELDELGRPAWLFTETVHKQCARSHFFDGGLFASEYGGKECLVELGCWGPVVVCNVAERGIVDGHGGCMQVGGICIGCTMPGFPDRFSPIYEPPGAAVRAPVARPHGGFWRRAARSRAGAHRDPVLVGGPASKGRREPRFYSAGRP
ncbi:MAG TPA: hypothetical protein VFO65_05610 [Acidimicrobiales bacterium]|nr:hypothetical protein [Acidimicrobiales bacterium]